MADRQQTYRRVKRVASAGVALISLVLVLASSAGATQWQPKRHFLSWESLNRPEEYRRLKQYTQPTRRFDLTRGRVVKLKPSTVWNRRPFQFSTPLVDGRNLYVGVDAGFFYCIDTQVGAKRWTAKTEGGVQAKAALADGSIYVGDVKAIVYALDASTGQERWRTRVDTEMLATPLVHGDRLYIYTMSGRLYALDRASGIEIWHTQSHERNIGFSVRHAATPFLLNGSIYVGTSSGMLIAFDEADGSIRWVRQLGGRQSVVADVDSTPILVNGLVTVTTVDGELFSVEPQSGAIVWSIGVGGPNNLLSHEGRLYVSSSGVVSALDPVTGGLLWQQDLEVPGTSAAAGGDRFIALVDTEKKLYLIDSDNGDILFERFVRKGSFGDPVVVGDQLYILSNSGRLFSFTVKEKPMKRRSAKAKEIDG